MSGTDQASLQCMLVWPQSEVGYLFHDFELAFSVTVSEMECRGYGLCHAELESPVVKVGGQVGYVHIKPSSMVCQFLLASRIDRLSVHPYLFTHVAGMSGMQMLKSIGNKAENCGILFFSHLSLPVCPSLMWSIKLQLLRSS